MTEVGCDHPRRRTRTLKRGHRGQDHRQAPLRCPSDKDSSAAWSTPSGRPLDGKGPVRRQGVQYPVEKIAPGIMKSASPSASRCADRHHGDRRHDPDRPRPARAHHRRPRRPARPRSAVDTIINQARINKRRPGRRATRASARVYSIYVGSRTEAVEHRPRDRRVLEERRRA